MAGFTNFSLRSAGCVAILAFSLTPQFVHAQGMEEIVVTARQRAETLQDVPASITAFTSETIASADIERIEDIVELTPGVVVTNNVEAGDTALNIRGINQARDGEANVAFIVDGILLTNTTGFNREFANVQQIEIVKGPQGALYGRSAVAGAVIVTTPKPSNDFEGAAEAEFGNLQTYAASTYVSGPLIEDKLFARFNAAYRTTNGFFRDSFQDDKIVDDFETFVVGGRLVWQPTQELEFDTKIRYEEIPEAGAIRFNQSFAFFEDVNDHDFVFQQNIDPINERDALEVSVRADYDFEWARLTAWGLYSDIDNFVYADGTAAGGFTYATEANCIASTAARFAEGVTLPPPSFLGPTPSESALLPPYGPTTCDGYQTQIRQQEDASFEIRLTSRDDQRFRWQAGLYYLNVDRTYGLGQGIDTGDGEVVRDIFVPGRTETLILSDFDIETIAPFGHIFYDITPELEFAFGLRWDQERRDIVNQVPPPSVETTQFVDFTLPIIPGSGGSPLNPAFGFIEGEITDNVPERQETFRQWQPKATLTWMPTDAWTVYGSWGVGFKSGGFNAAGIAEIVEIFINNAAGEQALFVGDVFDKEVTSAFELGFKSSLLDGRVSMAGAFFYTLVDDMQFFEFVNGPFGVIRSVTNIDEVTILGGEISAEAQVTDFAEIYAAAAIIDGEIDEHSGRPVSVGNEVPYTPKWTLNGGGQINLPLNLGDKGGYELLSRLDVSVVGPTWFHVIQDQSVPTIFGGVQDYTNTRRDAYALVNLRVGVQSESWSLVGFARNLTDTNFLDEVIPAPELGGSFISPGGRRQWGFQLSYQW